MAENQTAVETVEQMVAQSYHKLMKFRFKKDKMGNQRPSVELVLPVPSIAEILAKGEASVKFLQEVIADTIRSAAASIVADDEKISQDTFPLAKVDWHAIATAPRAERKTIDDSVWEEFAKDYLAIMPALTKKSEEVLSLALSVFIKKLSPVKTNKDILKKLQSQLAIYVENTQRAEEFQEIIELLNNKMETFLKADDLELLAANL